MDYRNADGSLAQMCGNGTRVFAAYLAAAGLVGPGGGARACRSARGRGSSGCAGEGAEFVTDLGPWRVVGGRGRRGDRRRQHGGGGGGAARGAGLAAARRCRSTSATRTPWSRCRTRPAGRGGPASPRPWSRPVPAEGTNVELVVPLHDATARSATSRCGCTSAGWGRRGRAAPASSPPLIAARAWGGDGAPDDWVVDVPGGRLRVTLPPGQLLAGACGGAGRARGPGRRGVLDLH